jgi:hypothetical protein
MWGPCLAVAALGIAAFGRGPAYEISSTLGKQPSSERGGRSAQRRSSQRIPDTSRLSRTDVASGK